MTIFFVRCTNRLKNKRDYIMVYAPMIFFSLSVHLTKKIFIDNQRWLTYLSWAYLFFFTLFFVFYTKCFSFLCLVVIPQKNKLPKNYRREEKWMTTFTNIRVMDGRKIVSGKFWFCFLIHGDRGETKKEKKYKYIF